MKHERMTDFRVAANRVKALETALLAARNSLQVIADGRIDMFDIYTYADYQSAVAWRALYP